MMPNNVEKINYGQEMINHKHKENFVEEFSEQSVGLNASKEEQFWPRDNKTRAATSTLKTLKKKL